MKETLSLGDIIESTRHPRECQFVCCKGADWRSRAEALGTRIAELTDALTAEQERHANMTRLFDESDRAVKEKDARIAELLAANAEICKRAKVWQDENEALRDDAFTVLHLRGVLEKVRLRGGGLGSDKSDSQVAGAIRMMTREDVDHEMVCVMARDRIIALSDAVETLRKERDAAEAAMEDATRQNALQVDRLVAEARELREKLEEEITRCLGLYDQLAILKGQRDGLRTALQSVQGDICGWLCPSVWKESDGRPPCSDRCLAVKAALAALSPSGEAPKYPEPGPFPTPEQMLKGAGNLECIATGIRDAVAGRVTPIEEIDPSFRGPAEPEDLPTIAEMSGLCEAGQLPAIAELSPPEPARERLHNPEAGAEAWWSKDGRFIDPDTSDVDWFDKRKELSKLGFVAGYHNALSVLRELRRQDAAMLPAERADKP